MTAPRGPQPFAGQEKRLRLLAFVRQDSVVRVDKRVEDTAMVWPHLLVVLVKVIFKGNTRDLMTAVWTGFVCVFLVLTIVGTSMRGPGMDMYAPWALPSTHQCFAP